jgi:molybdenum cofactor guanylyltransferase
VTPPLVILAGGQASRLGGGDKCLLLLGGRTILSHILARIGASAARVALNANGDPARFAAFGLTVLPDLSPDRPGPLAGVLAAMNWAGADYVATVPGDAPFLPPDLLARLAQSREAAGAEIALARSGGRSHPVAALWPTRLGPALQRAIAEEGLRRMADWVARHHAIEVDFSVAPVDPFFNINRPEDLAAAEGVCRAYPGL